MQPRRVSYSRLLDLLKRHTQLNAFFRRVIHILIRLNEFSQQHDRLDELFALEVPFGEPKPAGVSDTTGISARVVTIRICIGASKDEIRNAEMSDSAGV